MGIRPVPMYRRDAIFEPRADGSLLVCMREPREPYPSRLTERLEHWAALAPDRVFLACRAGEGWRRVSYAQALDAACAIGQALLDRRLSITREPEMWANIKIPWQICPIINGWAGSTEITGGANIRSFKPKYSVRTQ